MTGPWYAPTGHTYNFNIIAYSVWFIVAQPLAYVLLSRLPLVRILPSITMLKGKVT